MMHNPNLMYAIYPIRVEEQNLMETFFVNSMWKDHKVNQGNKENCYIVDEKWNSEYVTLQEVVK